MQVKMANDNKNFFNEESKAATLFDLAHIAHSEVPKYGEKQVNRQVLNACHSRRRGGHFG